MDKIIESPNALVELLNHVDVEELDEIDSWFNTSPNMDFHRVSILKAGNRYFLYVNYGLIGAVWNISESGVRQIEQKDSLKERAEFVECMTNEPIINRGGYDD